MEGHPPDANKQATEALRAAIAADRRAMGGTERAQVSEVSEVCALYRRSCELLGRAERANGIKPTVRRALQKRMADAEKRVVLLEADAMVLANSKPSPSRALTSHVPERIEPPVYELQVRPTLQRLVVPLYHRYFQGSHRSCGCP